MDTLSAIAEKSACCEFVGYDKNGSAFATERSPHPPPLTITFELRDTPSLAEHVEGAAKKGRPLIFLDTPDEHVEALSLHATTENGDPRSLDAMAAWLGKPHSEKETVYVDGIAASDLNGTVGFLKAMANKTEAGARALLRRFTLNEPAESWMQAEVKHLSTAEVDGIVKEFDWNTATEGRPAAVMVKFGATNGNGPPIDVSVVAGFDDADLPAGRIALYAAHDKSFALAKAKRESLARYALTVKSEFKRMTGERSKRLIFVVKQGKTQQLMSLREFQDWSVRYGAEHAG